LKTNHCHCGRTKYSGKITLADFALGCATWATKMRKRSRFATPLNSNLKKEMVVLGRAHLTHRLVGPQPGCRVGIFLCGNSLARGFEPPTFWSRISRVVPVNYSRNSKLNVLKVQTSAREAPFRGFDHCLAISGSCSSRDKRPPGPEPWPYKIKLLNWLEFSCATLSLIELRYDLPYGRGLASLDQGAPWPTCSCLSV